jgi:hypothetical protein
MLRVGKLGWPLASTTSLAFAMMRLHHPATKVVVVLGLSCPLPPVSSSGSLLPLPLAPDLLSLYSFSVPVSSVSGILAHPYWPHTYMLDCFLLLFLLLMNECKRE